MSAVTAATREHARQLLLHEAGHEEPAALAAALERTHAQLRRRLVGLIGRAGFAALFARALRLARGAHPGLAGVAGVAPDAEPGATPVGLRAFAAAHAPDEAAAALTEILAEFVGLPVAFIGEELALRLVREAGSAAGDGGLETEVNMATEADMETETGR